MIFIQADTLRRDHLNLYGHSRETAPFLARMAKDGVQFNNAISQASWTKVSTPSMMTGLYPTTHGVHGFNDRLPASVTTMAEVYKAAGYATLSLSSVAFTGQSRTCIRASRSSTKTARFPRGNAALEQERARIRGPAGDLGGTAP